MVTKAKDYFKKRMQTSYDSRLEGLTGSYRIDVKKSGSWLIKVSNGVVTFSESKGSADCIIGCDEEDFERLVEGKQNLLTALLQGRVTVEGDLALAQKLHALMRSRQQEQKTEIKKLRTKN